jgi:hypothetical protein
LLRCVAGLFAANMDLVGPAQGDLAHRILGKIVAQSQFGETRKPVSQTQINKRLAANLACDALGAHSGHNRDVTANLIEQSNYCSDRRGKL